MNITQNINESTLLSFKFGAHKFSKQLKKKISLSSYVRKLREKCI